MDGIDSRLEITRKRADGERRVSSLRFAGERLLHMTCDTRRYAATTIGREAAALIAVFVGVRATLRVIESQMNAVAFIIALVVADHAAAGARPPTEARHRWPSR